MVTFRKISDSIRDGSLAFRILNRFSKTKFGPVTELNSTQVIAMKYPGDGWKKLSLAARVSWNKFESILSGRTIKNVIWVGAYTGKDVLAMDEAFPGMQFLPFRAGSHCL